MDLEYVFNDQWYLLDKTQYMLLDLWQYLDSPAIWNDRTSSIVFQS